MKSIEEEISIWNLYDENKAFKIAQATPRNITALVRIIEEKLNNHIFMIPFGCQI